MFFDEPSSSVIRILISDIACEIVWVISRHSVLLDDSESLPVRTFILISVQVWNSSNSSNPLINLDLNVSRFSESDFAISATTG